MSFYARSAKTHSPYPLRNLILYLTLSLSLSLSLSLPLSSFQAPMIHMWSDGPRPQNKHAHMEAIFVSRQLYLQSNPPRYCSDKLLDSFFKPPQPLCYFFTSTPFLFMLFCSFFPLFLSRLSTPLSTEAPRYWTSQRMSLGPWGPTQTEPGSVFRFLVLFERGRPVYKP
jgi:hypothetical protein